MNINQQLEVQALVDGQLAPGDARRVERRLTEDAAAAALAQDLRKVRDTVRLGEPTACVSETRDFYFSQIVRRIEAEERAVASTPVAGPSGFGWIRSLLFPAGGIAALTALVLFTAKDTIWPYVPGEVTIATEEMNAITFRSEENRMTVVYLFEKQPFETADTSVVSPAD